MKFQQEYLVLKNIGPFKSGQVITSLSVDLASGTNVVVDLSKAPDWFKPLRSSWIPQVGETFFYLDENLQVQEDKILDPVESIDSRSPTGLKLAAGNFFKERVQALNTAHKVRETLERNNVELAMEESRPKPKDSGEGSAGVSGALR